MQTPRPNSISWITFVHFSLPTDVQAEAIPMILGGGDVLMVKILIIDISLTEKWNASQNNLYLFHCQMLFRVFIIRWVIISCYQFFFVLIGCWNWKWKNGGKKYIYKNHGCNTYSLIADKIGTNNIMKPRE